MPPNYQNSLGWLDLQLRSQREKDLQEQAFKREGMAREDRQLETQNSLALGKQAAQAMGDVENRKLQLADMMARAQLADAGKDRRQEDKQGFDQAKVDAQVRKILAEENLLKEKVPLVQAQTATIPIDDREAERSHRANEENTVRGQDLGYAGKLVARDPLTNQPMMTMAPGGKAAGIAEGLGLVPNLAPPGEVFVTKDERKQAGKDFSESLQESQDATDAIAQVRGAKKEFFNPIAGGSDLNLPKWLPGVGGKSIHMGGNSWKDLEANFDNLSPEQKADINQRRAAGQSVRRLTQSYRKKMTGAAFSDQESRDYLATVTGIEGDPFSGDQELLAKALERTAEHINRRTALLEHIKNTGRAPEHMATMSNADLEAYLAGGSETGARRKPAPQMATGPLDASATSTSGGSSAFVPNKELMAQAAADPVVSRKLRQAEANLPPGLSPEQKMAALQILASKLLPKAVNP